MNLRSSENQVTISLRHTDARTLAFLCSYWTAALGHPTDSSLIGWERERFPVLFNRVKGGAEVSNGEKRRRRRWRNERRRWRRGGQRAERCEYNKLRVRGRGAGAFSGKPQKLGSDPEVQNRTWPHQKKRRSFQPEVQSVRKTWSRFCLCDICFSH